jgi:hypothetical protein
VQGDARRRANAGEQPTGAAWRPAWLSWDSAVDPRHFMTPAEMEKYQCETRHQLASAPTRSTISPEVRMTLTATAAVWLPVCLPLAWGVWITLRRVAVLL